jgi:hypothetical protein
VLKRSATLPGGQRVCKHVINSLSTPTGCFTAQSHLRRCFSCETLQAGGLRHCEEFDLYQVMLTIYVVHLIPPRKIGGLHPAAVSVRRRSSIIGFVWVFSPVRPRSRLTKSVLVEGATHPFTQAFMLLFFPSRHVCPIYSSLSPRIGVTAKNPRAAVDYSRPHQHMTGPAPVLDLGP